MILQVKTEKELIDIVSRLERSVSLIQEQNKALTKKIDSIQVKPVAEKMTKIITRGVTNSDVLSIIQKHVTINYVNKLYKKGK